MKPRVHSPANPRAILNESSDRRAELPGFDRVPPHSNDAEVSALGAMMLDRDAVAAVRAILPDPDAFYRETHRIVYTAMCALADRLEPVDIVTLAAELRRTGRLDDIGGALYLSNLSMSTATSANAAHHARIIAQHWTKRATIGVAMEAIARCYDPATDAFEEADSLVAKAMTVAERRGASNAHPFATLIPATVEAIAAQQDAGQVTLGMECGLFRIDRRLNGWQTAKQYIVGGRPSMGKSAYGYTVARGLAMNGHAGLLISLEMSARSLAMRSLARESRIDSTRLQRADLNAEAWSMLTHGATVAAKLPIIVEDGSGLSGPQIAAMVRKYRRTHRIGWFILDYLSLAHMPGFENSRTREIGELAKLLREVAKDTDTCSIVLAQLNRAVESRGDKRPMLADLRDSGEIEQHADVVQFIHRPEYYGITQDEDGNPTEGIAEVITAKWRDGATGTDRMAFVGEYASFEDIELRYDDAPQRLPDKDAHFGSARGWKPPTEQPF